MVLCVQSLFPLKCMLTPLPTLKYIVPRYICMPSSSMGRSLNMPRLVWVGGALYSMDTGRRSLYIVSSMGGVGGVEP